MMSVRPSAKELLGSSLDKWWHSYPTHNQGGVTIMYLSGYIHYLYFCIFLCSMHFLYFLVPFLRSRRCQHYVFVWLNICYFFLYLICFLVQYPQPKSRYPFVFIWVYFSWWLELVIRKRESIFSYFVHETIGWQLKFNGNPTLGEILNHDVL